MAPTVGETLAILFILLPTWVVLFLPFGLPLAYFVIRELKASPIKLDARAKRYVAFVVFYFFAITTIGQIYQGSYNPPGLAIKALGLLLVIGQLCWLVEEVVRTKTH